jgi:putative transposase
MSEIIPLLKCLETYLASNELRQLSHVVFAMLCIPHHATMLGLSRWTEKGGSYRTLQRLYTHPLEWGLLHWQFVRCHLVRETRIYLLAADEVVISKVGEQTYGVGQFYSGLAGRVIPGISFFALALIDVQQRYAYPLQAEQLLPPMATSAPLEVSAKRAPGRPKGSKNHTKTTPHLSPELLVLKAMLAQAKTRLAPLSITYVILDGKYGTYPATWTVTQTGFHIISKLRHNAALFFPYDGPKPARGPMPRYGTKLNPAHLPTDALVSTQVEGDYGVSTYQMRLYHKDHPDLLNVLVVLKTHLKTGRQGHVILFSTDLTLSPEHLLDYYRLRFQIEFVFRDAKQHWGLDDFMNTTPLAVTNAVNFSLLMVNLAHVLLLPHRHHQPDFSVLDLKAHFRAHRYLTETINLLPEAPPPYLISRIWQRLSALGGIRAAPLFQKVA